MYVVVEQSLIEVLLHRLKLQLPLLFLRIWHELSRIRLQLL